jgi:hypothetical protein
VQGIDVIGGCGMVVVAATICMCSRP